MRVYSMKEQLMEKILGCVAKIAKSEFAPGISKFDSIPQVLGFDSLQTLQLVLAIEQEFSIAFSVEDFEVNDFFSIARMSEIILKKTDL
jgi:acyl carrier protein